MVDFPIFIESGLMLVENRGRKVERVKVLAKYSNFRKGFRGNYFETQFDFGLASNLGDQWQTSPKPVIVTDIYSHLENNLQIARPGFHLATSREILYFQSSLTDGKVNFGGFRVPRQFSDYRSIFGFDLHQLHSELSKNLAVNLGL